MNFDNDTTKRIIEYFRNSISDSERNEIDVTAISEKNKVTIGELCSGQINEELVKFLFKKKYKSDDESIQEKIDVLLCPLVFYINAIHGEDIKMMPKNICPLLIPAKLYREGLLEINEDKFPWIPRAYLEPSLCDTNVGEVDILDEFLSKNKKPTNVNVSDWSVYWDYCNSMFHAVTESSIDSFNLEYYTNSGVSYIVIDEDIKGARKHISKLYDFILTRENFKLNKLFTNFTSLNNNEKLPINSGRKFIEDSKMHYGQVGNDYPLSTSQRESLHHFNLCENGEILAVNGPPGTGKTTLLHSIIAQMVVDAALKQKEGPPVIVAASNNNQAVTNIIDSLGKSGNSNELLSQRWLPDIKSYGLYIASDKKINELKKEGSNDYHTLNTNNSGLPEEIQNSGYVELATEYFTKSYKEYFNVLGDKLDIKNCIDNIHIELTKKVKKIEEVIDSLLDFYDFKEHIDKEYKEYGGIYNYKNIITEQIGIVKKIKEDTIQIEIDFNNFRKNLKWYLRVLEFIPYFNKKSKYENRLYLAKTSLDLKLESYNTDFIKNFIVTRIEELNDVIKEKTAVLNKIEEDLNSLEVKYSKLVSKCEPLNVQININSPNYIEIIEAIDTNYRFEAFHLSIHYYEGKWIEEESRNIQESYEDKKSVVKQITKWRRYAKITPCFVSTFFMIPTFFSAWQGTEEYLFDFIDLLIVDEAGQVPPEIAAASFTLAKKSVVVGDTLQIEPVWGVTETVDRQNMMKFKIVDNSSEDKFSDYGMSASSGNVMKIAQNLSTYAKFNDIGGMYLTEHRRCVPEIIKYCNDLAYYGRLEAKRENKLKEYPFPHIGHVHVAGQSKKVNTSWKNEIEANAIVEWIEGNMKTILSYYTNKETRKVPQISECIGVVTPFAVQANVIKKLLTSKGLGSITVGTVHKLQGAERNIVLFSTVYTSQHTGGFFFDRKPNMLNVAVSRAKDSFIVFGDSKILDKTQSKKPSGLLAKYVLTNSR
jgi:superfamily I DNA and/or RNA helicase